jgi:hypothetical protein
MRDLSTQALNRYLSVLGVRIRNSEVERLQKGTGPIIVRPQSGDSVISPTRYFTEVTEALDHLEDWDWFQSKGGTVFVDMRKRPIDLHVPGDERSREEPGKHSVYFRMEAFPILPPWLRPCSTTRDGGRTKSNPLTLKYRSLLKAASFGWDPRTRKQLPDLLRELLVLALDRRHGAPAFLRREVLGRRLTRSARAVIVPRPELKIDEIGLPTDVLAELMTGLTEDSKTLVLVNRNPTLHRTGLLALRPRVLSDLRNVFALPLGILSALGADFDGDQVSVIALETPEALQQAQSMFPGSTCLRLDPFRQAKPAFPLLHELSCPDEELQLALLDADQQEWVEIHDSLLRRRLEAVGDGWHLAGSYLETQADYWRGLPLREWQDRARTEMEKIYAVREKGRKGGVLRRQLYLRAFFDGASFATCVGALHAVTERITQTALSVKTGHVKRKASEDLSADRDNIGGPTKEVFAVDAFFADPIKHAGELATLDPSLDQQSICRALATKRDPVGLLRWFAKPDVATLMDVLDTKSDSVPIEDPRLQWFIR